VERRVWKFSKGASAGEPSFAVFGGVVFQGEAKSVNLGDRENIFALAWDL